jgi:hypothetical protein
MAVEARSLIGQLYRPERIGPELMDVYETALRRARAGAAAPRSHPRRRAATGALLSAAIAVTHPPRRRGAA